MIFKDRVRQQTNTIGTFAYSLSGNITGYQTFADSFVDGDITSYCVTDGDQFEISHGTIGNSGLEISRDTIVSSSNNNNPVNWLAGTKDIFCTLSADLVPIYGHGDPTATINPSIVGFQYINLDTGSIWICTDNTTDNNIWMISGLTADDITGEIVTMSIAFSL